MLSVIPKSFSLSAQHPIILAADRFRSDNVYGELCQKGNFIMNQFMLT